MPHSVLDLSRLPVKSAIDAWHQNFGVLFEAKLRDIPDDRLPIHVEGYQIDSLVIERMKPVPQTFHRSRARIARDGIDHYSLHVFEKGSWILAGQGNYKRAEAPDVVLQDHSQPHTGTIGDACEYDLIIPRRLLAPLLKTPDEHSMNVLPGSAPLVVLLRNHIQTLYHQASVMTRAEAKAIVQPTLQLIASAINGSVMAEQAIGVREVLADQIRHFIDQRILDDGLSAASIAADFGISVRKLYALFEPSGGVLTYIQAKRLRLAHAAITDPARMNENIHAIAEAHGFIHRKNFITAFRAAYGMTPREARAFALEGKSHRVPAGQDTRNMWDWIRDLR
ncbi:helix-turn-helix domain-containing protein [Mesorhizobium sp. BAC0120]|uniref:helix-turn-helix domain-containing protein n=1 Tax=Mesorhizobium sp. BAC0120 TaxID=3090670 RepID=UPI00298C2BBE|nr:helix-turn-helix domain-containing protein [Mesorhizobium sp. BAC0120]MDW6020391.1 helix-turn-helix domain-containing protein [Mesorhizobium sp. BAC0120]